MEKERENPLDRCKLTVLTRYYITINVVTVVVTVFVFVVIILRLFYRSL